jgi:methylglutaconyl-CoA hydratase
MEYKYIEWESREGTVTLWLNRPEKRNALNHEMVLEISQALQEINKIEEDIIVLLRGRGEAFCSGADLEWMQQSVHLPPAANFKECLDLSQCFFNLYSSNKITIAIVHGAAFGGGVGLAAACDLAICTQDTRFSLSELRMGLVASTISPYILRKLGESKAKELVFTSRQFIGKEAESIGLVNRSVPAKDIEIVAGEYISLMKKGGVKARGLSKQLIQRTAPNPVTNEVIEDTAKILADVRTSNEAQERMKSYLLKVKI